MKKNANAEPDTRGALRVPTELRAIVQVKESLEDTWKEVAKVTTVSRNGVGLNLSRQCAVGRLVQIVMPMPAELRAHDETATLYQTMGIIQHSNKVSVDGETVYHTGIALVGKEIPPSFEQNPLQNYRITGMATTGLWNVSEVETSFSQRKHPRFWIALEVNISHLQKAKKLVNKEVTVTQNIGASGASVATTLDANVGDTVKFACKAFNFYSIAMVRNRKENAGGPTTLHLEFIGDEFPVAKLHAAALAAQPDDAEKPMPAGSQPVVADGFEFDRF